MTDKMRYYNVEEFNKQKRQQGKNLKVPPRANFLAAANHFRDMFESKKIAYGTMGGLEMLCLGYRREMPDIQIAYDDRDFTKIKAKLESDQRVRLPDGMNPLFPSKILVRTGPAYRDSECTESATIEVDLIPPGSHGTPPNGMLSNNLVLLSMKPDGKLRTYKGLNMLYLVKTLVHYARVRDLAWDPRKDILFLCQYYGEEVQAIRNQLDQKAVQQNFLGTNFLTRQTPEDQRRCYQILLGKEPPPVMAITPPAQEGHRHSHSASDIPRPRMTSHKSSPSLNMQTSAALLSPPLPGKPKSSRQQGTKIEPQPVELSASPKPPAELPASNRDSRSRYRPISAPNTRNNSPEGPQPSSNVRPQSMDPRNLPRQQQGSSQNPQVMAAQSGFNMVPQTMPNLMPAPVLAQGRRSMPNLNAASSDQIAPMVFGQTPFMNGGMAFQSFQQQFSGAPVEMSATPAPYNPGQEHLKSQLGLGGDYLLPQMRGNKRPITNNPIPPAARTAYAGPQQAKLERSGTPQLQSQAGSLHVVSPDGEPVPSQQCIPNLEEVTNRLHLVGPEGIYQAPLKPKRPSQDKVNGTQTQSQQPFVFELDSTPQHNNIVAELSDNIDAAIQSNKSARYQPQELPSEPIQPKAHTAPTAEESPVSPPDSHMPPVASHEKPHESSRPVNPRTQSAPVVGLPASLMVGGASPRFRSTSNNGSYSPPQTESAEAPVTKTNASRYTRYYSPPSSTPGSNHASPQLNPSPLSVYKAYQPPSIPLSPPELQTSPNAHTERQARPPSFAALKDVDGEQTYFRTHKRDASHDSHASSASHDSSKLAQEYQAELPSFEHGYGSK